MKNVQLSCCETSYMCFSVFLAQEEFKHMIEDAGFHCVQYYNLTGGIVALHSGFKLWNLLQTPGLKMPKILFVHLSLCRVLRHKFESCCIFMDFCPL